MGDAQELDRPSKRARYEPEQLVEELPDEPQSSVSHEVSIAAEALLAAESLPGSYAVPPDFHNPWSIEPELSIPTEMLFEDSPVEEMYEPVAQSTPAPRSADSDLELSPTATEEQLVAQLPQLLHAAQEEEQDDEAAPEPKTPETRKRKPLPNARLVSPFTDCRDRLEESNGPRYARPINGQVNGYVKFNWPSRRSSIRSSVVELLPDGVTEESAVAEPTQTSTAEPSTTAVALVNPEPLIPAGNSVGSSPVYSEFSWGPSQSSGADVSPPEASFWHYVATGDPRMLPPHFGFQAKMDRMDRRLWEFYIKNWCPGRSVLNRTNLWLKDFAQMHQNEGIRSAIQSLAGIYIYDYLPDERIRRRINERYLKADAHFTKLLAAPESSEPGQGSEVITMAVILSMQDIVLTEGRRRKPSTPRWLEGFMQGEHFLQVTDPGCRFWRNNNIQMSNLRISQSIIVGRAVILAQPMMQLPDPKTLDPQQESARFGWLLYGTEKDMYEIHGGCGFSKKLLHMMSQVTYCAARLVQEPDSNIVPITAGYLHQHLLDMRQWSSESESWTYEENSPRIIDWVRSRSDEFLIDSDGDMTDVTAEAWRIAVVIYLQCRVFRLPRNHPEVISLLNDLAKCIQIMPTSGSHFTAQAPLLPVFLLGMLATAPVHRLVSQGWFDEVVGTPVRSSVPPLYTALQRIWTWIDDEVQVPSHPSVLPTEIGKRVAWWEDLVDKVHEKEEETLCLT